MPLDVTVRNQALTVRFRSWRCTVAYNCAERAFAFLFSHYGRLISRYPYIFIAFPLIVALTSAAGIHKLEMYSDAEYLFTPDDGRAKHDREAMYGFNSLPISSQLAVQSCDRVSAANSDGNNNSSGGGNQPSTPLGSDVQRQSTKCRFAHALIIARPGVNLFDTPVFFRISELDRRLTEFKVRNAAGRLVETYETLCERSSTTGECLSATMSKRVNPIGLLYGGTYPYFMNIFIGPFLGGVRTEGEDNRIAWVEATQLYYCLGGSRDAVANMNWEMSFLRLLTTLNDPYFEVYPYSASVLETEIKLITMRLLPKFGLALGALILFSMVLCLANDSVRSKPWLGMLGILSTGLATAAAFGFSGWIGVPFITLSTVTPFLTLGIGIDDMFVLMNAWNRTNPRLSVEKRLSLTMEDAGTSITITSFVNVLSFIIGSYMPYPGIQIFSKVTTAAMFFDFFLQMSFFAACLALFGHVEAANRHSLLCCARAEPRSIAIDKNRSTCFAIMCTGGATPPSSPSREAFFANADVVPNEKKANNMENSIFDDGSIDKKKMEEDDEDENDITMKDEDHGNSKAFHFFRRIYAPALLSLPGRICVLLLFVVYIGLSLWGASQIHEGLRMEHLAPDNSTSVRYFMNLRRYFRHYGQSVSLVFMLNPDLDYSDSIVQRDALELFTKLESSSADLFWGEEITEFWLRDYLEYLRNVTDVLSTPNERLDLPLFVNILRCKFLRHWRYKKYEDDIRFDPTGTRIVASRGVVVSRDVLDSNRERLIMTRAREVADSYHRLGVFAYNQEFVFYDQYITVLPLTIYNILIAVASVIIASLLMIVHPVCIFWLFMTILSIIAGIFGLMAFWEVDLDSISMVCIIICVGYCVDYATHLMHAYVISEHTSRREKTIEAVCDLGLTVVQAGCATTLSILAMATSEAYIFRTFFKTLFICIVLSSVHAMVILPVFLSMFGPISTRPDLANKPKPKPKRISSSQKDANGHRRYSTQYQQESSLHQLPSSVVLHQGVDTDNNNMKGNANRDSNGKKFSSSMPKSASANIVTNVSIVQQPRWQYAAAPITTSATATSSPGVTAADRGTLAALSVVASTSLSSSGGTTMSGTGNSGDVPVSSQNQANMAAIEDTWASSASLPLESAAHQEFRRASGLFSSTSSHLVLLLPIHASTPASSPPSTPSGGQQPAAPPTVPPPYHGVGFSSSSSSTPVNIVRHSGSGSNSKHGKHSSSSNKKGIKRV